MSRVLWLSPWLRPLARVHAEALARLGHDTLLVTSDQHPESGPARPYELVLVPSPKRAGSWPQFVRARRAVREFAPDVVVGELVRDPRWLALSPGVPRVSVIHDDRPHGPEERRPRWERAVFDRWHATADAVVTFSRYVCATAVPKTSVRRVFALPSDLDAALAPAPAPAAQRRDIVMFGRLNPYKNVDVVLAAWEHHVRGPGWRGDELLLIGAGSVPAALPASVRHVDGPYRYADAVGVLHRAKASLAHYRVASQSGVQVLSMQLGVVPIVSDQGGLPEYQPDGERPIAADDVAGLAARLDELADPAVAARRGEAARRHYEATCTAEIAGAQWAQLIGELTGRRSGR